MRLEGSEFGVQGSGSRDWGLVLRIEGSGMGVDGLEIRV